MNIRRNQRVSARTISVVFLAIGLFGCGGNGGEGRPVATGAGSSRSLRLFVTDSFREDVDQVFLTIVKVELIGQDNSVTVAYDDAVGHQFDAKSLRDSSGQIFNFLANATIPSRIYSAVRLTLKGGFTIAPKDQLLTKTLAADSSVPRDAQGRAQITFPLTTPRDLSADTGSLVIDVDLANFRYNGGDIVPAFAEGSLQGLSDLARQQNDQYRVTIRNLSQDRFDAVLGNTRNLPVTISSDAVIFSEGGTGRNVLTEGADVETIGKFDIASGRFLATEIRVVDNSNQETAALRPQANGRVTESQFSGDTGSILITTERLKGFRPVQTTIRIATSKTTTGFFASNGGSIPADQFHSALSSNTRIYVEGDYDPETNILTAQIAKLEQ